MNRKDDLGDSMITCPQWWHCKVLALFVVGERGTRTKAVFSCHCSGAVNFQALRYRRGCSLYFHLPPGVSPLYASGSSRAALTRTAFMPLPPAVGAPCQGRAARVSRPDSTVELPFRDCRQMVKLHGLRRCQRSMVYAGCNLVRPQQAQLKCQSITLDLCTYMSTDGFSIVCECICVYAWVCEWLQINQIPIASASDCARSWSLRNPSNRQHAVSL